MQTDSNQQEPPAAEIAAPMSDAAWLAAAEAAGDEDGYFEALGTNHFALFRDDSPTLLVTFESAAAIRAADAGALPLGHRIAAENGWSSLALVALADTWFRDAAVFAFFDRLVDEAFFEDFDRVVFFGAGMGGYGAAAFSVTAPGAQVILVAPQATLDPAVAGWDPRFARMRRTCFTDRYGYAPDMIEGAGPVFIAYDPRETLDAMHAALFTRPFVTRLPCRGIGAGIAPALERMGVTGSMLRLAGEGRFAAPGFRRLWRARRDDLPYLRGLVATLCDRRQYRRAALVCRSASDRLQAPRFAARLAQIEQALASENRPLPPRRTGGP